MLAETLAHTFENACVTTARVVRTRESICSNCTFVTVARNRAHRERRALHAIDVTRTMLRLRLHIECRETECAARWRACIRRARRFTTLPQHFVPRLRARGRTDFVIVSPHGLCDITKVPFKNLREPRDEIKLRISRHWNRAPRFATKCTIHAPDRPPSIVSRKCNHALHAMASNLLALR